MPFGPKVVTIRCISAASYEHTRPMRGVLRPASISPPEIGLEPDRKIYWRSYRRHVGSPDGRVVQGPGDTSIGPWRPD